MAVAFPVQLLHTSEVVEGLGEVVVAGPFPSLDALPRPGHVGHVVAESDVSGPERVEHPACPPLDLGRGAHPSALRARRASWASAGPGSSGANTAST